jgi:hypothetical protein
VKGMFNKINILHAKFFFSDDDDDDGVVDSGDGNNEGGKPATCKDYMLHFISFFWKFLFAFVPPTSN